MTYRQLKEKAREEAVSHQTDIQNNNLSYGELAAYQDYFQKIGKRYGLLTEFRENGLI